MGEFPEAEVSPAPAPEFQEVTSPNPRTKMEATDDSVREQIVAEMRAFAESKADTDCTHSTGCWKWHTPCAILKILAAIQSLPSPAPAAPGSGEDDWEEPSGNHCACVFDPATGKQLQQCSTHATLTAENERLTASYRDLAGIAERMSQGWKLRQAWHHVGCPAIKSVGRGLCVCGTSIFNEAAAEYAAHLAKGKP